LARTAEVTPSFAYYLPIISDISFSSLTETGHLVLIAEWTANAVSVEIAPGFEVHESDGRAAFDGGADWTDGCVMTFSDLP